MGPHAVLEENAMLNRFVTTPLRFAWAAGLGGICCGCFAEGSTPRAPQVLTVDASRAVPELAGTVTDLTPLLPPDVELVGLAAGFDGQWYVLDARRGIYALSEGGAELVFDLSGSSVMSAEGVLQAPPDELTDIALFRSSGVTREGESDPEAGPTFVVTAENDGYLLSLPGAVLESHFCYFPRVDNRWGRTVGDSPVWDGLGPDGLGPEGLRTPSVSQELRANGLAVAERTEAVAVGGGDRIMVQPRTIALATGTVAGSELFVFGAGGGDTPEALRRLDAVDFRAGGMTTDGFDLWMVQGSDVYHSTVESDALLRVATVEAATDITGMADVGRLSLMLDGPSRRVIAVERALLLDAQRAADEAYEASRTPLPSD